MMTARRERIVWVAPELLAEVLTTGYRFDGILVKEGLPAGVCVKRVVNGEEGFGLVVEHHSFEVVPPSNQLPRHRIAFERRQ